ncbi:MAG TPA: carbohydrate ABC transporter permease [Atribacteraceae bacterium]|nr:carbohydrate ABC transporter permease [Atribacteraceae bacterium]
MSKRKKSSDIYLYIIIIVMLIIFLFPVYWIVTMSLKTRLEAISIPPVWFFRPTLDNYATVLSGGSFPRNFMNSLIISISTVFLSVLVGTPAAYALARFHFRHKDKVMFWILSTRMAPPIAVIIPFFLIFRDLRLLDSHMALIIVYLTFNLSFVVWLMRSFFRDIPSELEEAALVDGATDLGAFAHIALPLSIPGVVASTILCFIFSWNEFFYALILTRRFSQTLPVTIHSYIGFMGIEWERMAAGAVMAAVPILVLALIVQKYLVRGLTLGAVK